MLVIAVSLNNLRRCDAEGSFSLVSRWLARSVCVMSTVCHYTTMPCEIVDMKPPLCMLTYAWLTSQMHEVSVCTTTTTYISRT